MNTISKYKPKNISEFVFPDDQVEAKIKRYVDGKTTEPLILHGPHGTGKTLLSELLPNEIEGKKAITTKVNAEDLNNSKEVRGKFNKQVSFDRHFTYNNQKNRYTVVQEVNFDPKAKGALRVCLDELWEDDIFIFTTNEVRKIDPCVISRAQVVEVSPAPPKRFFPRAKAILHAEDVEIDDQMLMKALEAVYENDHDNRAYYRALDEIIEAAQS